MPRYDPEKPPFKVVLEYYQPVFYDLHKELEAAGYQNEIPHTCRSQFWNLLLERLYAPHEARPLLIQYLRSVERRLQSAIQRNSIAYWLHLYRRLAPGPIGEDTQLPTIAITRAVLEAAIQKYAKFALCGRVGITNNIPIDQVLKGGLAGAQFEELRAALRAQPQLVLTDFGLSELREFYEIEKLAYEVWRTSAQLRIVGKGSPLVVCGEPDYVRDARSPDLARLIKSFDDRNRGLHEHAFSSTGVVASKEIFEAGSGLVFLPTYNVGGITAGELEEYLGRLSRKVFPPAHTFNFVWLPFDLRNYREAHKPFAEAFESKHGVSLDSVLTVIAALCKRVWFGWTASDDALSLRFLLTTWQRAYEGPKTRKFLGDEIGAFVPHASTLLNLNGSEIESLNIAKALRFLELDAGKRSEMDLAYPGPHSLFLPCGTDHLFIDYAWVLGWLYDLFTGVSIPDQNFKGEALEVAVRRGKSVLRTGPCKFDQKQKKQIDSAFEAGSRLVIVECRVVAKSIGFDRGNPDAIRYRNSMVEKALTDVDEKAVWLANHPVGLNYDVRKYKDILPVAVTPFVEFIPSWETRYWLTDNLPRVLTIEELRNALGDGTLEKVSQNVVRLG